MLIQTMHALGQPSVVKVKMFLFVSFIILDSEIKTVIFIFFYLFMFIV